MPRFTLAEREKVVEEAINLIKEPANWTTGKWKCPLYQTDEEGNTVYENDVPLLAHDLYNRPVSQYCIEGAVNQAVVNVLGEKRAIKLGAYDEDEGDIAASEFASIWPTDILGIDDRAREKYPDICEDEERASMVLNDYYDHEPEVGHKRILGLLRDTLDTIKAKRKG